MILKHIKILIGKQEQLPVCIFQHPPFDRVYIVAAASVAALPVCTKINVVCLCAADVGGSSAVYKLDGLAGIGFRRKCRLGQQPHDEGKGEHPRAQPLK